MAAITFRPPVTGSAPLEVRAGTDVWVLEPGIPQVVPGELRTAIVGAIQAAFGNLNSPTPSVTPNATGTTTVGYQVVAVNANGDSTPSPTAQITNSAAAYNNTLNWAGATGATAYKILRGGQIIASSITATTFTDNNATGSAYTPAAAPVGRAAAVVTNTEM